MTETKETILHDEAATVAAAAALAPALRPGDCVTLRGDLGAGKSVFARALIRSLAEDPALDVPSPTYTLVQTYDTAAGSVSHFDLYRLTMPDDVFELGWDDALTEGIAVIEWPERAEELLPARRLDIALAILPDGTRRMTVTE